jgi:hypothetical protein
MIVIENTDVYGWEAAIRGMRNPMNSWDKSDSEFEYEIYDSESNFFRSEPCLSIGDNDHDLMMRLAKGGPVHAKYRRMIVVYVDITAPLYWWKEFDTYKVGTTANSCSTMHKIHEKEITLDDFSHEHLESFHGEHINFTGVLDFVVDSLNVARRLYLETKDKTYWWQMIQLLPTSYNQRRTVMLNYEVLANMYKSRKDHKLDEWMEFCRWIETLPYSELITGVEV